MRYASVAEGIEFYSSFDEFVPFGGDKFDTQPESLMRFGEEQLYALALWLYALEPPANPKPPFKHCTWQVRKCSSGRDVAGATRLRSIRITR
jgi:hypothetical protein